MEERPMIVMTVGAAVRLVFVTGLVVALMVLAMTGGGRPAPQDSVDAPASTAPAQPHG
jgi:hypothetical protein